MKKISNIIKIYYSFIGILCLISVLAIIFNEIMNDFIFWTFIIISCLCFIGSTFIYIVYWRCPYCKKHFFPSKVYSINHCPHCGEVLN